MPREHSLETNQILADKYVEPLVSLIDQLLSDPDFGLTYLEETLAKMDRDTSTASAVAGIMVPLESVERRVAEVDLFRAITELAKQRAKVRETAIRTRKSERQMGDMAKHFGLD